MRRACNSKMPEWESWNSSLATTLLRCVTNCTNKEFTYSAQIIFFTREKFLSVHRTFYLKLNNGNIANIYFEKAGSVLVTDVVASEGLVLQRQWNVANCLLVLLSPGGRNRLFLRNSHPLTPLQHSFGRKYRKG